MPRNAAHHAPGRGLRRPPKTEPSTERLQNFVDDADTRDTRNIQDVRDIPNVQDTQNVSDTPDVPNTSRVKRTDGRILQRTTVYLKPELHQRLKKAARLTDSDGSTIINELLETHLTGLIQQALEDLAG